MPQFQRYYGKFISWLIKGDNNIVWRIAKNISFFLSKKIFCVRVIGLENIKDLKPGNVIFAANHASGLDPFLIGGSLSKNYFKTNKRLRFMTHYCFTDRKYYGFLIKAMGAYSVYPGKGDISEATKTSREILANEEDILIFPTAKRSRYFDPNEARQGVAYIARAAGSTIVPVYIEFSDNASFWNILLHRKKILIVFGQPFNFNKIGLAALPVKEAAVEIMHKVAKLKQLD